MITTIPESLNRDQELIEARQELDAWRLDAQTACYEAQQVGLYLESHSGAADCMRHVLAQLDALRQELAAAQKEAANWRKDFLSEHAQASLAEALVAELESLKHDFGKDMGDAILRNVEQRQRAEKAEAELAAARTALGQWLAWTHIMPIGQYPMDVRMMTEKALGYKSDVPAPADAQGAK